MLTQVSTLLCDETAIFVGCFYYRTKFPDGGEVVFRERERMFQSQGRALREAPKEEHI